MSSSRFPFPTLLRWQACLPQPSRDPGPNWALARPSGRGCGQSCVQRLLARRRAADHVYPDGHKGLNPEAGWGRTWSQVTTWSVAPRPAQAPPPPRPSACRLRPFPPGAPSSLYLHKEAAPRPAQRARDPGEAEGTC